MTSHKNLLTIIYAGGSLEINTLFSYYTGLYMLRLVQELIKSTVFICST